MARRVPTSRPPAGRGARRGNLTHPSWPPLTGRWCGELAVGCGDGPLQRPAQRCQLGPTLNPVSVDLSGQGCPRPHREAAALCWVRSIRGRASSTTKRQPRDASSPNARARGCSPEGNDPRSTRRSESSPTVMPAASTCLRQFAQKGIEMSHGPAIGSPRFRHFRVVQCGMRSSKRWSASIVNATNACDNNVDNGNHILRGPAADPE